MWLHIDVNVLDPSVMPVLFPEAGGLTPDELRVLVGAILRSGGAVGLDVACYHPVLDPGLTAVRRLVRIVAVANADLIQEVFRRQVDYLNRRLSGIYVVDRCQSPAQAAARGAPTVDRMAQELL